MPGCEWVVDAHGCDPENLRDLTRLQQLLAAMVRELALHPVGEAQWHKFPEPGGVTGLCLLAESHFACHTFPEHGTLALNLFCCRERPRWDFESYLRREFGATAVSVRTMERPYD